MLFSLPTRRRKSPSIERAAAATGASSRLAPPSSLPSDSRAIGTVPFAGAGRVSATTAGSVPTDEGRMAGGADGSVATGAEVGSTTSDRPVSDSSGDTLARGEAIGWAMGSTPTSGLPARMALTSSRSVRLSWTTLSSSSSSSSSGTSASGPRHARTSRATSEHAAVSPSFQHARKASDSSGFW